VAKQLTKRERQQLIRERVARGVAQALQLKTVVCNSEAFDDLWAPKQKCGRCGREVYVNPLFDGATLKLCINCAPHMPEIVGEQKGMEDASR
jgi:hypothetical protein